MEIKAVNDDTKEKLKAFMDAADLKKGVGEDVTMG